MVKRTCFLGLFFLILSLSVRAQHRFVLKCACADYDFLRDTVSAVLDSSRFEKVKTEWILAAYSAGHLEAGWQQSKTSDSLSEFRLLPGPAYVFSVGNIEVEERVTGLVLPRTARFSPQNLETAVKNIIYQYQESGYPFAIASLTVERWDSSKVDFSVLVDAGPRVQIDSMVVRGIDNIPKGLLRHGLGIKLPRAYSEKWLAELPDRAELISFLQLSEPPRVAFSETKNVVYLDVQKAAANRFDGIVGLNTEPDGNTSLTGSLDLDLTHIFGWAENIVFSWQRPDEGIQQLRVNLRFPYLLNTPFGVEGGFRLFAQDSTFSNRIFNAGLLYQLSTQGILNAGYRRVNSRLLPFGTQQAGFGNTTLQTFTVGLDYATTRNPIPRKGYTLETLLSTGNRELENQTVPYNEITADVHFFQPIFKKHHLMSRLQSGYQFSESLFANELFRLGGLRTFRGFNEQSLFASGYSVLTLEYRFFLDKASFLQIFTDMGAIENPAFDDSLLQQAVGAGLVFSTRGGIFSLAYALGRQQGNPFDLRTGKVHVGYINTF